MDPQDQPEAHQPSLSMGFSRKEYWRGLPSPSPGGLPILDSILKSRDIPLPTKVRLVKAMVCPVVMYGCGSWTVKKEQHWKIDAFELWFWRRRLRVPWTATRSNQSIPKEISPGISLEGMMLKLKLQYFGHFMRRVDALERLWCLEGLGAGGEWNDRGWDGWMASLTRWTWVYVNSRSSWWTGRLGVLGFLGSQSRTWLSDWSDLIWSDVSLKLFTHKVEWVPSVMC